MYRPKLAFLALLGLYFGISMASAEPGFQPALSANLPLSIRKSGLKILQIWTPLEYASRPQNSYATIHQILDKAAGTDVQANMRHQINREELALCERRGMSLCVFTVRVAQGSAFVLEDGTLIAARHDFSETQTGLSAKFAALAADWKGRSEDPGQQHLVDREITEFKANPLKDTMFILSDSDGKIVFNSFKQEYKFLRFGELNRFRGSVDLAGGKAALEGENSMLESPTFGGAEWINRDSVRIQTSVRLPALTSATQGCGAGSPVYIAGFPGVTTVSRSGLGGRESVYGELSVTRGEILSLDQVAARAEQWSKAESYLRETARLTTLITDADGTIGMSGGAILNGNGEVCGMFKALFPGDEKPDYNARTHLLQMFSFGIPLEYLTGI